MKNQPFVSDWPLYLVSSYWHDKLVLPKSDVYIWSKQLFRYVFAEKMLMVCYSLLDSKVIGRRYLKFPFDIRELPYKLRIGKEKRGKTASIQAYLAD